MLNAIRQGGKVMVCVGRDRARGVSEALTAILKCADQLWHPFRTGVY